MSIFTCGLCKGDYDKINKIPLSLPCGHVFCKECIRKVVTKAHKGIKCPKDNKVYQIQFEKIPICVQILSNLPPKKENIKKTTHDAICLRHPNNKIEFFCKTHSMFLCSVCIAEHNDHNIVVFKQDEVGFGEEIKKINKLIDNEKEKYLHHKIKYEQIINQINEYFIKENKKVSDCFDKLYKIIKEKKNELIKQLGVIQKEKLQSFDDVRRININIADKFIELNNSMLYIKNDLLPKGQYEHFYHIKIRLLNELKSMNIEKITKQYLSSSPVIRFEDFPIFHPPEIIEIPDYYFGKISSNNELLLSNSVTKDFKSLSLPSGQKTKSSYQSNSHIVEEATPVKHDTETNQSMNKSNEYKDSVSSLAITESKNIFQHNLLSESNKPFIKEEYQSPMNNNGSYSDKKEQSLQLSQQKTKSSRETGRTNITGSTKFSTYNPNPILFDSYSKHNIKTPSNINNPVKLSYSSSSKKGVKNASSSNNNIIQFSPYFDKPILMNKQMTTLPNNDSNILVNQKKIVGSPGKNKKGSVKSTGKYYNNINLKANESK